MAKRIAACFGWGKPIEKREDLPKSKDKEVQELQK